jgi:hypothetical protein
LVIPPRPRTAPERERETVSDGYRR